MERMRFRPIVSLLLIAGTVGCAQGTPTSPPNTRLSPDSTEVIITPTLGPPLTANPITPSEIITKEVSPMEKATPASTPSDSGLQKFVNQAKQDLAQHLDISPDKIEVVEVKAVVWRDSSLGCPQPGMAYLQVLQDGLLIRLKVGDKIYNYHSGGNRPPFLCENPARD
jgi:hypothetical protein